MARHAGQAKRPAATPKLAMCAMVAGRQTSVASAMERTCAGSWSTSSTAMIGAAIIGMPATAPPTRCPKRRAASVDSQTDAATSASFSSSIGLGLFSCLAEATAARRVDLEHVARLHLGLADVGQLLRLAVGAHHPVDADLARLAARHAEGAVLAAVGQDAGRHRLQEAHAAHAAVAARASGPRRPSPSRIS